MKVFITGASGYIGNVVTEKLLKSGHTVSALARSLDTASKLEGMGVDVILGDLEDYSILEKASRNAESVIHTGFKSIEKGFAASLRVERKSVEAMVSGLGHSHKSLIYTGGTGLLGDTRGKIYDENVSNQEILASTEFNKESEIFLAAKERLETETLVLQNQNIKGIVIRPPNVYGRSNGKALIKHLEKASRKIQAVPYANSSATNLWSFVHVDDLAELYVLALEKSRGGEMYYASGETGIKTVELATALSKGLDYEGRVRSMDKDILTDLFENQFMSEFWSWNNQTSNYKAKRLLGWTPKYNDMLNQIAMSN